jgi:hypothetical protein
MATCNTRVGLTEGVALTERVEVDLLAWEEEEEEEQEEQRTKTATVEL